MALGPGMVLAEGVGSAFCPLSLSRRLRLFASPALPVSHAAHVARRHAHTARRRRVAEANHRERRDVLRTRKRIGRRAIRVARCEVTDSSTVGDTSPRDALRGKRHAVAFPCALSAPRPGSQHGDAGLLERTIASDATYSVAGNRIDSRGTAASWAKGLALRTRSQGDRCGFPHRRAGSRKQPCFAGLWSENRALSAKRSLSRVVQLGPRK